MSLFTWVRGLLIGVVFIMAFRLFAAGLGWDTASIVASYLGAVLVMVGVVLTIIGTILGRQNPLARRFQRVTHRER